MFAFQAILEEITFSESDFNPEKKPVPSSEPSSIESNNHRSYNYPKPVENPAIRKDEFMDLCNNKEIPLEEIQHFNIGCNNGKLFKKSASNPIVVTIKEFALDYKEN